jgi:hypothetical protein
MWALGCCSGSLPSRIREAGINGLLPAVRVPSIYSVSPLRVLDRRLPEQREVTVICVRKILANLRSANRQLYYAAEAEGVVRMRLAGVAVWLDRQAFLSAVEVSRALCS